ncbi:MAG: VOC family protein [Dehalococcoidia bacterium]
MLKGVHHVTYIVEDVPKVVDFLEQSFGLKPVDVIDNPKSGLKEAYIKIGPTIVDFFQPMHDSADFAQFLREKGPGISHVGWQVEDIDGVADRLVTQGVKTRDGRRGTVSPHGYKTLSIDPANAAGFLFQMAEGELQH